MTPENSPANDSVLRALLAEAGADPHTVGLILGGSRGADVADHESDYDLEWVLTDAAWNARTGRGEPLDAKKQAYGSADALLDLSYTCPRKLCEMAANPGWWSPGYATARVLLDKTGEVTAALAAIATLRPDKAAADAPAWFDAYLNALCRSLKAWRRNNELGARLQAAESAMHLVRCLFALEQPWAPYHDRLVGQLDTLNEVQNWPSGYLQTALLRLARDADPAFQQELGTKVTALLRARGHGRVVDDWHGEIERVLAFSFPAKPNNPE